MAAGFATAGDLLEAATGEGESPLAAVALEPAVRDAAVEAVRAYDEAPEDEDEGDTLEFQEVTETEGEKGPEGDPQT